MRIHTLHQVNVNLPRPCTRVLRGFSCQFHAFIVFTYREISKHS